MGKSLSKSFEERFDGIKGRDSPKKQLVDLLRNELDLPDEWVDSGSCQRVYLSGQDLYALYVAWKKNIGEKPEYVYSGRSLLHVSEFEDRLSDDDSDNEKLRELFNIEDLRGEGS